MPPRSIYPGRRVHHGGPQLKHTKSLRLKIDTGAQGNALPIRTFKQMYGNTEPTKMLTPIGQTTLTAYSGERIKCIGSITLACRSGQSKWVNAIFYVVDVRGPVILGLATCEALKMVTISCKVETVMAATEKRSISSVKDMVYYDVKKPITLEVDASMKGLGAALVQEENQ